jgi:hypothetical protein
MTQRYIAVPATPAEQQDPQINPSGGPLGWIVVRSADETLAAFGHGYVDRAEAERTAGL